MSEWTPEVRGRLERLYPAKHKGVVFVDLLDTRSVPEDIRAALSHIDALKLRVAALEAALRSIQCNDDDCHRCNDADGDSVLRALLVEAVIEAWDGRGYPTEGAASKSALAQCIADRILKRGGK